MFDIRVFVLFKINDCIKVKLNKVDKEYFFLVNDIFDIFCEEGFGKVLK